MRTQIRCESINSRHAKVCGTDLDSKQKISVAFIPYYGGNPYQDLLKAAVEKCGCEVEVYPSGLKQLVKLAFQSRVNVVHFHWPDPFILGKSRYGTVARSILTYCLFKVVKLRGIQIVWTVHNLHNHENRFAAVEREFLKRFVSNLAFELIVHCEAAMELVIKEYGEPMRNKISVVEHGHYTLANETDSRKDEAREKLGWEPKDFVFLFVGNVRLYKGILELVESFEKIGSKSSVLLIAGKVSDLDEQEVLESRIENKSTKRIRFEPGFVSKERLPLLLSAADVFVAPFRDVLTSGSVILAMSNGLPVIAPRLGCLPETLGQQKELTYCPDRPEGLLEALEHAIENRNHVVDFGKKNLEYCIERLGWSRIGKLTADIYARARQSLEQ